MVMRQRRGTPKLAWWRRGAPHLAALAGVDAVVETGGHVPTDLTQQHQAADF